MYNKHNNNLTQKQENFTRYIFQGMSQREAWGKAGYSTNYPVKDVDTHACALVNSDKVKTRLVELNARVDDKAIMTKEEKLLRLTELAKETIKQPVTAKEVILSIAEQNKMLGDYAPEKRVNLNANVIFVVGRGYIIDDTGDSPPGQVDI